MLSKRKRTAGMKRRTGGMKRRTGGMKRRTGGMKSRKHLGGRRKGRPCKRTKCLPCRRR